MGEQIRILLAEDHSIVLEGIASLLRAESDFSVVASATEGISALALSLEHRPDVIVTDIGLPGMNGIELTRRILAELPSVCVLALSMHDDFETMDRAIKAGVRGYILKGRGVADLCQGIRAVVSGETWFALEGKGECVRKDLPGDPLSDREREVLQLVAEGYTAKEIAGMLHVSPRTIENHRANIMDRLGIHTIAGLVRYAIRNRICL